ncbi:MAG TPA: 3-oxoacyl-ACP synthase [Bacteroidia bacterium]|nr:3-oxoacyl-ACP synthase [Bacteroidia bacterium]
MNSPQKGEGNPNEKKMIALKKALHDRCREFLASQIENLNVALKAAQDSGNEETKSTTGDKHETGRAMMQMEQEKIGHQLQELLNVRNKLDRISTELSTEKILPGNIVITDQGNFYIAIAAGKLVQDGKIYFAISPASPLGILFLKSAAGEKVRVNGKEYLIQGSF